MIRETYTAEAEERLRDECDRIMARYPDGYERSALLPMLHLVQSEDGYVSPRGISLCADVLGLTRAEVSAVATFYSQYKRHPNGEYTVGVCTNALCAVMGGDTIFERVSEHLGIGHDETTADGRITLEEVECNAACDYAPVIVVNWEFFDNQTPTSAVALVVDILAGRPVHPTRGADRVVTFKEMSHVLAGFEDGLVDQGPAAGPASLLGLGIAHENDWTMPHPPGAADIDGRDGLAAYSADAFARASEDESQEADVDTAGEHGSSAERPATTPSDTEAETVTKSDQEAPTAGDDADGETTDSTSGTSDTSAQEDAK